MSIRTDCYIWHQLLDSLTYFLFGQRACFPKEDECYSGQLGLGVSSPNRFCGNLYVKMKMGNGVTIKIVPRENLFTSQI